MERGQEPEQGIAGVGLEHLETGRHVGDQVVVGERHGLGSALRTGGEEKHRRVVGPLLRQSTKKAAGSEPCGEHGGGGFQSPDPLLDLLEKLIRRPLDLDAKPVHEFSRREDPLRVGDADALGEVGGAGGPVHRHRHLAGEGEGVEHDVGRGARGQHHAHVRFGVGGETAGHQSRGHEHSSRGEHPRDGIGDGHGIGLGDHAADEGLRDRVGEHAAIAMAGGPAPGGWGRDRPTRRRRRCQFAVGKRPEAAERVDHGVAPEAKLLLDGEGEFHAVEAVEADGVEPGLGLEFVRCEIPFEVRCEQFVDQPDRLWRDRGRIDGDAG